MYILYAIKGIINCYFFPYLAGNKFSLFMLFHSCIYLHRYPAEMIITCVAVFSTLMCSGNWLKTSLEHISEGSIQINVATTNTRLNLSFAMALFHKGNICSIIYHKMLDWKCTVGGFDVAEFLIVLSYCSCCREGKLFSQIGVFLSSAKSHIFLEPVYSGHWFCITKCLHFSLFCLLS